LTRQLATLLASGVHVVEALEVIGRGSDNPELRDVVQDLAQVVSDGNYLSHGLRKYPMLFPEVYINLVRVGENSSTLNPALERLATWLERDAATRKRLGSAMIYPAFIFGMTMVFVFLVFHSVLPGLLKVFEGSNQPIPWVTRLVMGLAWMAGRPEIMISGLAVGAFVSWRVRALYGSPDGKRRIYRMLHRLPVLGSLLISVAMARFCSSMQAMLAAGLSLVNCLSLGARTCGHPLLEDDLLEAVESIRKQGCTVAEALTECPFLPSSAVHLLSAGEESGSVDRMFRSLGRYYEEEVGYKLDTLGALIEPALLLLVSAIVATVLIAVFLPLYGMLGEVG
jgi:type IV pilus assembly protein PilC